MATTLYFRQGIASDPDNDFSSNNNDAGLNGSTTGWTNRSLWTARGVAAFGQVTNTEGGPTSGVEVASSGGKSHFISPPISADVTISGSITVNLRSAENNMNANTAINAVVEKVDGTTGAYAEIGRTTNTGELTTSEAAYNLSITPTSTTFHKGDRIRVRVYGDDSSGANMGSGNTFTFWFGGPTGGASGDSYITFTETFSFASAPTGTTIYPTGTASDIDPNGASYDAKEAWTSRGGGAATATTNTVTGWTAPLLCTASAGGNFVEWFTKPLQGVTLGGPILANVRWAMGTALKYAVPRCEIHVVNNDGTSPVLLTQGSMGEPSPSTTEGPHDWWMACDDTVITAGQRLRIRFYADDFSYTPMVSSGTGILYYAGTSGGGSGDTYLTFSQTLAEFAGVIGSFSANAVLKRTQEVTTAKADAVIKKTFAPTGFGLDAVIKKPTSFTTAKADATIKATMAFTTAKADAVLKKTIIGVIPPASTGFTADAEKVITYTFTDKKADAVLKREQSFTTAKADAVIFKTMAFTTAKADAVIKRFDQPGSTTADAILKKTIAPTGFTADATILKPTPFTTAKADATIKRLAQPGSTTLNAIVRRTYAFGAAVTVAQDSFTEGGSGFVDLDTHTAEVGGAWVEVVLSAGREVDVDRTNDRAVARDHNGGAFLLSNPYRLGPVVGDGYAQANFAGTTQSDTESGLVLRLQQDNTDTYYFATIVPNYTNIFIYRVTNNVSSLLASGHAGTGDYLRFEASGVSPTRLRAFRSTTSTFGAAALDVSDNTAANNANASGYVGIRLMEDDEFGYYGKADDFLAVEGLVDGPGRTVDAWLAKTQTGSLAANAIIKRTIAGSVSADAIVRRAISASFSADAIVFRNSGTKTVTSDAVLKRTQAFATAKADAVLLANSGTKTFTVGAAIAGSPFFDDFSRTVVDFDQLGGPWVQANPWPFWEVGDPQQVGVDGSAGYVEPGKSSYFINFPFITSGEIAVDLLIPSWTSPGNAEFNIDFESGYVRFYVFGSSGTAWLQVSTYFDSAPNLVVTPGVWYRAKINFPGSDDPATVTAWPRTDPVPPPFDTLTGFGHNPDFTDRLLLVASSGQRLYFDNVSIRTSQPFYVLSKFSARAIKLRAQGPKTFTAAAIIARTESWPFSADAIRLATIPHIGDLSLAAHGTPASDLNTLILLGRGDGTFGYQVIILKDGPNTWGYGANHVVLVLDRRDDPNEGYLLLTTVDLGLVTYQTEWQLRLDIWGDPTDVFVRVRAYHTGDTPPAWTTANDSYALIPRSDSTYVSNVTLDSTGRAPYITADAELVSGVTTIPGSLTADAVVLRAITGSFAADAVIRREQTGAATLDAILRKEQVGSLTADAVIQRTASGSTTADAVLFANSGTKAITADAVLLKSVTPTGFGVDAVILRPTSVTTATDAVIKRTQPGSATADAIIFASSGTKTFTANAVFQRTVAPTAFALDAVLRKTITPTALLADAVVKRLDQPGGYTVAAVLRKTLDGAFAAAAILARTTSSTTTADATILRTWTVITAKADAWLLKTNDRSTVVDAVLQATIPGSFGAEALIYGPTTFAYGLDAVLQKTLGATSAADAVLQKTFAPTGITVEAWKVINVPVSTTADAVLKATELGSTTLNAVIRRTVNPTTAADATLLRTQPQAAAADAVLLRTEPESFTSDAWLQRTVTPTATVDAVLQKAMAGAFAIDAITQRSVAWPMTADATLARTQGFAALADAILAWTKTDSFVADAVIQRTAATAFAADAVIKATISGSFTAAAVVTRTATGTFVSDAVLTRTQAASLVIDAIVGWTRSGSITADAVVLAPSSGSLSANAVVLATRTESFAAAATIARTASGSFTVDAIHQWAAPGAATVDATVLRTQGYALDVAAWLSGTFPVSAWLAGAISVDAFIQSPTSGATILDAILFANSGPKTFTVEAEKTLGTLSGSFTVDAIRRETMAGAFDLDGIRHESISSAIALDAVIRSTVSGASLLEAVIRWSSVGDLTAEAIIQRTQTGLSTVDATVAWTATGSLAVDAVLVRTESGSTSVDAILERASSTTFTTDAVLGRLNAGAFTSDAVLTSSQAGQLLLEAVLRRDQPGSMTADAILLRGSVSGMPTDAAIIKPTSVVFPVDSTIASTGTGTSDIDAVINSVSRCVWTTPGNLIQIPATATLGFLMPATAAGNMHFEIHLDTVATFDSGDLRILKSHTDLTGWEYWDGAAWQPIPQEGVANTYCGNEARYTIGTPLENGTWYRRVRAGVI